MTVQTQVVIVANLDVPEEAYTAENMPPVLVEQRNAEGDPMGVVAACPTDIVAVDGQHVTALMAAASPQMLAALKAVHGMLTNRQDELPTDPQWLEVSRQVRAAIGEASYRILEIEWMKSDRYADNEDAIKTDDSPCAICGKGVKNARYFVHVVDGGGVVLHPEDEAVYEQTGDPAADCGLWPVGPDCRRKHETLKPFITDTKAKAKPKKGA